MYNKLSLIYIIKKSRYDKGFFQRRIQGGGMGAKPPGPVKSIDFRGVSKFQKFA